MINLALQFDLQAQEMAQKKYGDRELWGKKEKIQFSSLKEVCVLLAESSQTYQGGAVPAPISSAPTLYPRSSPRVSVGLQIPEQVGHGSRWLCLSPSACPLRSALPDGTQISRITVAVFSSLRTALP